jgi:peptidoglycan/LPS O-acetylase OafA/YrhL
MSRGETPTTYRPALDGIRAVAVVAVMLYHGAVGWAAGGFLGVDVFFVLSGYLITSLLLREHHRWGSIDLVGFYRRRARRLLPALFLVVMAVAWWTRIETDPQRFSAVRADGIATLLYVANWRFVLDQQSYFDQYGDPSPFRHMWSLAIEEQYYLLFPLILAGLLSLASRGHRWVLPAALLGATGVSVGLMAALSGGDLSRAYFGTDTRIHELLIGSLLATAWRSRTSSRVVGGGRAAGLAGLPALACLLGACALLDGQSRFLYLGGFAVVCGASAVLIWSVEAAPTGPAGRLLSLPPLVWIGLISYGLYLWHWPVYLALTPDRTGLDGVSLLALRLAVTTSIAAASFLLVERPIRRGALAALPARIGTALTALCFPTALASLLIGTAAAVAPPLQASPFPPAPVPAGESSVLLVGDSVGSSLVSGFPAATHPDVAMRSATVLGCGLGPQQLANDGYVGPPNPACDEVFGTWRDAVERVDPDVVVLMLGPWEVADRVEGGRVVTPGSRAFEESLTRRLAEAHEVLTAAGARLIVPNVPCYAAGGWSGDGETPPWLAALRDDPRRVAAVNAVLGRFVMSHSDVTAVDLAGWLCPGGNDLRERQGVRVRSDGVHFTPEGAAMAWNDVLIPAVQQVSGPASSGRTVLLIGDSVPLGLFERFPQDSYPELQVRIATQLGCSAFAAPSVVDGSPLPFSEDCSRWQEQLPATVTDIDPDVAVVFLGLGEQFDKAVADETLTFGSEEHLAWLRGQLTERIEMLHDSGVDVVVATSPCHQVADDGTNPVTDVVNDDSRVRTVNELVRDVRRQYPPSSTHPVGIVDLYADLCAEGYDNEVDGKTLRDDGLHFSPEGAAYVWSLIVPSLRDVADDDG